MGVCGVSTAFHVWSSILPFEISQCFSLLVIDSIPLFVFFIAFITDIVRANSVTTPDYTVDESNSKLCCQSISSREWCCMIVAALHSLTLLLCMSTNKPDIIIAKLLHTFAWVGCGIIFHSLQRKSLTEGYTTRAFLIIDFIVSINDVQLSIALTLHGSLSRSLFIIDVLRLLMVSIITAYTILIARITSRHWISNILRRKHSTRISGDARDELWNEWLAVDVASHPDQEAERLQLLDPDSPINTQIYYLEVIACKEVVHEFDSFFSFSIEVHSSHAGTWTIDRKFSACNWFADLVVTHTHRLASNQESEYLYLPPFPTSVDNHNSNEVIQLLQIYLDRAIEFDTMQKDLKQFIRYGHRQAMVEKAPSLLLDSRDTHISSNHDIRSISSSNQTSLRDTSVVCNDSDICTQTLGSIIRADEVTSLPYSVQRYRRENTHNTIHTANVIDYRTLPHHIVYIIEVRGQYQSWHIDRRFSAFVELHSKLTSIFDTNMLPVLPQRTFLSSMAPHFIRHRQRQLSIYISAIVHSRAFSCRYLHDFLFQNAISVNKETHAIRSESSSPTHSYEAVLTQWRNEDITDTTSNILYCFEIREYFSPNEYLKWCIYKQFDAFQQLHKELMKRFTQDSIPSLPSYSMFTIIINYNHQDFINNRARKLEVFLKQVMGVKEFICSELNSFLALNDPTREIATGMTIANGVFNLP